MDTKELSKNIRQRFSHADSKLYLQEKYQNQLLLPHNGGLWSITPEFISTLKSLDAAIILVDIYNTPIEIDPLELLPLAQNLYNDIMSQWLAEYTELSSKR